MKIGLIRLRWEIKPTKHIDHGNTSTLASYSSTVVALQAIIAM